MPTNDPKREFKSKLEKCWLPLLKEDGFVGKPFRLVRHKPPTIFVVDLQLESKGSRYAVNIGFQLDFLELGNGSPVLDVGNLRPSDCMCQRRLANEGQTAQWWEVENASSPEDIANCYLEQGRPLLTKYSAYPIPFTDAAVDSSVIETMSDDLFKPIPAMALITAKVNWREGNREGASRIARWGLERAPSTAKGLREALSRFCK